jgi:ribosomal protein S18 acetylase RimI-like enzyme
MSQLVISPAHLDEMGYFCDKAQAEGWNPGLADALPFYTTDPEGFFIAKLNGRNVGCISAVAYDDRFGFMGFYIVDPEHRGEGIGLKLWEKAIDHLGNRTIGLDGVVAQQENYKKSGFTLAYRNVRYEGKGLPSKKQDLVDLRGFPLERLLAYDAPIFGVKRRKFLQAWLQMHDAHALGKVDHEHLLGYGVIRPCVNGFKIGPLFADNLNIAQEIYEGLASYAEGQPLFLDIPSINQSAEALIRKCGLKPVFETARMYKGTPPAQQLEKVFGVTTFELG